MRHFITRRLWIVVVLIVTTSMAVRCGGSREDMREQDLLKLVHERPMLAGRVIRAVLGEAHGTELLAKELKANPRSARVLVETMLADRDLGPMVRERCQAHLASNRPNIK